MREGRLRGDKGVREEGVVNPRVYLLRAISLAKQEMGIISLGFFCLAVTSVSGLILPNYQVHTQPLLLLLPPPSPSLMWYRPHADMAHHADVASLLMWHFILHTHVS